MPELLLACYRGLVIDFDSDFSTSSVTMSAPDDDAPIRTVARDDNGSPRPAVGPNDDRRTGPGRNVDRTDDDGRRRGVDHGWGFNDRIVDHSGPRSADGEPIVSEAGGAFDDTRLAYDDGRRGINGFDKYRG